MSLIILILSINLETILVYSNPYFVTGLKLENQAPVSIFNFQTPKHWMENWKYGPNEILSFVKGLLLRHQALERFLSEFLPVVDMSRLARPRAFLTVLKQHTARETRQPMENLRLCVNWFENDRKDDWKISLVVEGLLISGNFIRLI